MPKTPQVSIKGETYAKLKKFCDEHNLLSIGKLVDKICSDFFKQGQVCDFEQKRASDFVKKSERG